MKKNIQFAWILLALILAGCDHMNSEGGGSLKTGLVTITNLPYGYVVSYCQVSRNPTPLWSYNPGGIYPPSGDSWNSSLIGFGNRKDYWSAEILGGSFSSSGQLDRSTDFNYTGTGSLWIMFATAPGITFNMFGVNSVQFNNGRATVDWNNFTSFALPPTEGLFTLTGAGDYNGKYAIAVGANTSPPAAICGFNGAASFNAWKGSPVSGGKAEIPLYYIPSGNTYFSSYDRSETPAAFIVYIVDNEALDYSDPVTAFSGTTAITFSYYDTGTGTVTSGITFSGGKGTTAVSEGTITVIP